MDRTSVARRIQLGAVRLLQTKIAEASLGLWQNYGTAVLPNVVFQYEYVPLLYTAAVHALYSTTAVPNTYYD